MQRRMARWLMNGELGRMWKEAGPTHFEALSLHLSEGIPEDHEDPQSG
jgi:hypothetical protein